MFNKKILISLFSVILLSSCATQNNVVKENNTSKKQEEVQKEKSTKEVKDENNIIKNKEKDNNNINSLKQFHKIIQSIPTITHSVKEIPITIENYFNNYKNARNNIYIVKLGDNYSTISNKFNIKLIDLIKINNIKPPYNIYVGKILMVNNNKDLSLTKILDKFSSKWNNLTVTWPVDNIEQKIYEKNNILNIHSKNKEVFSITDGKVVYVGRSATTNEEMIILEHKNGALSVYANLSETFVKKGDEVKSHQQIANLYKENNSFILRFSIRKEGEVLDSYKILPTKKIN